MFKIISSIVLSTSLSFGGAYITENFNNDVSEKIVEEEIVYEDPHCRTPYMPPDEVAAIINQTKTMDLNFVALAKAESGLNNTSYYYKYRGIFQVHEGFHKLDDYCDPVEQVQWLERKLNEGAKPANLFPSTYYKLYN
ncbi:hypothetical protein GF362_00605 [Candidatus Dojkabacteria bacterium]|nr:hypothetical protein [Candidatus Dojkabacteria bacterium]